MRDRLATGGCLEQADHLGLGEQVRVEGLMGRGKFRGRWANALGDSPLAVETAVAHHPETSAPDAGLERAWRAPPGRQGLGGSIRCRVVSQKAL